MNFNNDISKIPLPSYPIPGLSELIDDLPQTGQGQLHQLSHHDSRHEAAARILNTPATSLVPQKVDTFSTAPAADHINAPLDPSLFDGVNTTPLLHAVLNRPSDVYGHRNTIPMPSGLSSNLSHPAPFVNPSSVVRTSIPASFSTDTVANSRVQPTYPGNTSRLPVSRPVQAVAPQPRNPRLSERSETAESGHGAQENKLSYTPSIPTVEQTPTEEKPKICLKIRRTKKSRKKEKHHNKVSNEYGIVSSDSKPEGTGPIKLKLSRLKPSSSGDSSKPQSAEQTFKVSSLTTVVDPESSSGSGQQNPDGSIMVRNLPKDKEQLPQAHENRGNRPHHVKSSQSEMQNLKHPPSHKVSKSSSRSKNHSESPHLTSSQPLQLGANDVRNYFENQNLLHSNPVSANQKMPPKQDYTKHALKQSMTSGSHMSSYSQNSHFQAQSLQSQSQMPGFFPPTDQHAQQMMQKHFMTPQSMQQFPSAPHQPNMTPQLSRNSTDRPTNREIAEQSSFAQQRAWDVRKQESRNKAPHGSGKPPNLGFDARPPPYNEAMVAQQRAQAQLYQSLNIPMNLPYEMAQQRTQQEQQPIQQQHQQQQMASVHMSQQHMSSGHHQTMQNLPMKNEAFGGQKQQQLFAVPPPQQSHQQTQKSANAPAASTPQQQHVPFHSSFESSMKAKPNNYNFSNAIQRQSDPSINQHTPAASTLYQHESALPNMDPTVNIEMYQPKQHHVNRNSHGGVNYMNTPRQSAQQSPHETKPKKKGHKSNSIQHVRVKFLADDEEADIYKLKDIMYPDDTEVSNFEDLHPGMNVVAKWPMNGKLYAAVVIDPLDNTGRRFRERKPPPKPFQAQHGSSRKDKKQSLDGPSVVLNKLTKDNLPHDVKCIDQLPEAADGFNAYISMADRIKLKRRERLAKAAQLAEGKKRKRDDSSPDVGDLINMDSDESEGEFLGFAPPSRKRTHQDDIRKKERRRAAEMRLLRQDGSGTFQRFMSLVKKIFDDMDSVDPRLIDEVMNDDRMAKIPQCLLISRGRLQDLSGETAKLKAIDALNQLPKKTLVRLLTVLEPSIRDGVNAKPLKLKGATSEEQKWNRECDLDRVSTATEAALVAMCVMTARFMPKAVYIDDVIESTAQLLRRQLNNTIYPEYDLVYKTPSQSNKKKGTKELTTTASTRMKRAHYKGSKNRSILQLYNKLNILLNQMVELVDVQPLTDTSILKISSLGVSPFFVENVRELQLSAIRLTTSIFSRYDKHRSLILEDIFQSLARLPTSKRNLRSYRLTYAEEIVDSSDEEDTSGGRKRQSGVNAHAELQHIQMVSALVLQMIHAIAHLPIPEAPDETMEENDKKLQNEVDEMKVISSYDVAVRTGQNFLSVFLKKCASKSEEIDYRPMFENVVRDLLATVNKPEWPASEMLLSVLGRLLVHTFSKKSTEMSLRVASLDYLGVVAAKLRHDAVTSRTDVSSVRALLRRLEEATNEQEDKDQPMDEEGKENTEENDTKETSKDIVETEEEKLICRLQYLLLGYLRQNADADPALLFAHNFYIGQWLRDVSQQFQQLQQHPEQGGDAGDQLAAHSRDLQACQRKKDKLMELALSASVAISNLSKDQTEEGEVKKPLKISELQQKANKLAAGLTVEDAALVSRHLASTRPFSRAFDCYLSYILRVRDEPAVALRTRAIKCLAEVVAVDPSIMEREDIAQGVQASLVDPSTSVREAAIDLVGKFILLKPNLVKHYYGMLTARILDTGVGVRKRVIRILRDLCHEYPDLPQLTDACVKMIRRVNDEEGIKKLVHEVFMKMWFSPVNPQDTNSLRKKALLITDIVAANRERGYEWIEQLFKNLIDTSTRNPRVEEACRQIVDCLVQHVIIFENPENKQNEEKTKPQPMETDDEDNQTKSENENNNESYSSSATKTKNRSIRLVATVQTLVQLARIRPRLLVAHVMTLQPYLATKCETSDDVLTVYGVCRILELAIPLMEHPSEAFLASIEEDMMRMILTQRFHIVSGAVACLGAVTCRVTHNYRLIWDCFQRMCTGLSNARSQHQKNSQSIFHPKLYKQLLRTLFIIGHFAKNFDFDNENIKGNTQVCVKDKVYDCLFYFANLATTSATEELRGYSIAALGLLMVQDPNMMFRNATRELYKNLLDVDQRSDCLKKQVLQNLQNYLQTEDVKMQEAAEASAKKVKHEDDETHRDDLRRLSTSDAVADDDIKEICDVSSGMASSVMQLFLKQVLEAFFHRHVMVRHAALHTVYLTLQQGLVHPVQCVPYLIAAASDPEPTVHKEADQQLVELNKRYHGFVHTKALQGMRLAYQLQSYVQSEGHVVRGYLETTLGSLDDGISIKASCSQLYQLVRSDRKHRRALLLSLLHLFDDTVKTDLQMLVFVADNLAYFPYHTLDEPLHLISQIEVYVSVSGSNVLQSFKESLLSKNAKKEERMKRRAAKLKEKEEKRLAREARSADPSRLSDSSSSSSSSSESSSEDDDEDSDDEESIESRLPVKDEAIEEFAHLSLACLLLLWLKQHLKTLFGFTDNKIHKYSPTEVNRANDKQCHRRRPDLRFNPLSALQHIVRQRKLVSCRDPEYTGAVVKQYTEFNELMNKLDPNEEDSDSDKEKTIPVKNVVASAEATTKEAEEIEESDRDTDDETKPTTTLDAIRHSTALKTKNRSKHKKHDQGSYGMEPLLPPPEMRKRAPIQYMESSSESEEEFHGF